MVSMASAASRGVATLATVAACVALAAWARQRRAPPPPPPDDDDDAAARRRRLFAAGADDGGGDGQMDEADLADRVLRKAETVLLRRTSRFLVVVEVCGRAGRGRSLGARS